MFLSELFVCGKCSYNCSQIDNFEGNTNCFNTSVKTNSFTNIRRRGFSLRTSPGSRRDESNSSVYTQTMSLEQTTCEDLKAFERRLTEVIACLRPNTIRWRMILIISTVCTAIGTWQWLNDPLTSQVSFTDSLLNHLFFTLSSLILGLLFLMGIHKRVVAPSIITARTRVVLADFNMSCDETGKLILKPRPANT